MRWTNLDISTFREEPAEGDPRKKLLVRAGYWQASGPRFLGQRSLDKIERVLREEGVPGLAACGLRGIVEQVEGDLSPEPFHTPGIKTIAELAAFTGVPESGQMKSVVMRGGGGLVLALVRGDHFLNETKLRSIVGGEVQAATAEEIRAAFRADPGSLGRLVRKGSGCLRILLCGDGAT